MGPVARRRGCKTQLDPARIQSFGVDECEWLIARGARLNPLPGACYSPLTQASEVYQPEKVRMLLSHGADPNAPTRARFQYDMTQTLRPSEGEMSPLSVAIGTWYGPREETGAIDECRKVIGDLLQGGADVARNYRVEIAGDLVSLTALQFAHLLEEMFPEQGFQRIIDVFRQALAN